jgi:hypothetical protein
MKLLLKLYPVLILGAILLFSCEKPDEIKVFPDGVTPELTVIPSGKKASFFDSSINVLNLNWTDPKYAQDKELYLFSLQIDTVDGDFKNSVLIKLDSVKDFKTQLLGYQINNILYKYGLTDTSKVYDIYIRVLSSYGNNNEPKQSKAVKTQVSPYATPKVPIPVNGELWIVGNATDGVSNPLFEPLLTDQKFTKIDPTKFEIKINLYGNRRYLIFPVMGSDVRYCIDNGLDPNLFVNGGSFVYKPSGGQQFRAPISSGIYKITLDFMTGTFTVVEEPVNL